MLVARIWRAWPSIISFLPWHLLRLLPPSSPAAACKLAYALWDESAMTQQDEFVALESAGIGPQEPA